MFTLGGQGNTQMTSLQPLVILISAGYNRSVTVEQWIRPHDGLSSQRLNEALATENEALSENGVKVRVSLFQILERYREQNPDLVALLADEISAYPISVFNQLGLLVESPVFKAQEGQKGHWVYELTMVERTLACAPAIERFFGQNDRFVANLIFMIVVSDIGKAGPVEVEQSPAARVVSRIYNQGIFHLEHQNWLKNCDPTTFPQELQPALAQIDRQEPPGGGLSAWDLIFKNGTFIGLPIEVYLYIMKQVALTKLGGAPEQVDALFSLNSDEENFLAGQGFDPAKTPIRKFFTSSHIYFGQKFLLQDASLKPEHRQLVAMAMAHHLSQGELPRGFDLEYFVADEHQVKVCAYLEILDKVDAVFHRSNSVSREVEKTPDVQRKAIEMAINITQTEIQSNLSRNFPEHPRLNEIYAAVLSSMREAGVFNFA